MTAQAMKGDKERCLASGMDGYVSKPIRADVLAQVIREVMDRLGERPSAAEKQNVKSEEDVTLDWDKALNSVAGDQTLLNQVVEILIKECPTMMDSIRQALKDDGILVVVDPERIEGTSNGWVLNHVRCGKGTVTDEILNAGFELVEEAEIDTLKAIGQYLLKFRKRI